MKIIINPNVDVFIGAEHQYITTINHELPDDMSEERLERLLLLI